MNAWLKTVPAAVRALGTLSAHGTTTTATCSTSNPNLSDPKAKAPPSTESSLLLDLYEFRLQGAALLIELRTFIKENSPFKVIFMFFVFLSYFMFMGFNKRMVRGQKRASRGEKTIFNSKMTSK